MNYFNVIACGYLILGTLPCIFGKIFDVEVSYALANEMTRYDDLSVYKPFHCNDTIDVNDQTIYLRFQSWNYFEDAASFTYSPETNLYEADAYWNFYRGRDTVYAVGYVTKSVSDITYSFSFTASFLNREDVYTCEVHLVVTTFPVIPVVASIVVVLIILCVLAGLWVYNRKKQSNVNPTLMHQDRETKKCNYYENVQFFESHNDNKTVK